MTWTHPYASGNPSIDRCVWTAGGGNSCQEPADAPVHQRTAQHEFQDRFDGRCGFDVGGGVLCGQNRPLPVHRV